jgi:hypothetical protein
LHPLVPPPHDGVERLFLAQVRACRSDSAIVIATRSNHDSGAEISFATPEQLKDIRSNMLQPFACRDTKHVAAEDIPATTECMRIPVRHFRVPPNVTLAFGPDGM